MFLAKQKNGFYYLYFVGKDGKRNKKIHEVKTEIG